MGSIEEDRLPPQPNPHITEAEAKAHLPALRVRHAPLTAKLASLANPVPIIEVHPAAVDAYLRNLARLDEVVNAELADKGLQAPFAR
jgi:hypothetical protein